MSVHTLAPWEGWAHFYNTPYSTPFTPSPPPRTLSPLSVCLLDLTSLCYNLKVQFTLYPTGLITL